MKFLKNLKFLALADLEGSLVITPTLFERLQSVRKEIKEKRQRIK